MILTDRAGHGLTTHRAERVKATAARGEHLGPPPLAPGLVKEIRTLAASTNLSIREIHGKTGRRASRGRVGEITEQVRSADRQVFRSLPAPSLGPLICLNHGAVSKDSYVASCTIVPTNPALGGYNQPVRKDDHDRLRRHRRVRAIPDPDTDTGRTRGCHGPRCRVRAALEAPGRSEKAGPRTRQHRQVNLGSRKDIQRPSRDDLSVYQRISVLMTVCRSSQP